VSVELGFLWDAEPSMVVAHFRKFVASRYSARRDLGEEISLEGGDVRRVVEGGDDYGSVVMSGVVPGSIGPGRPSRSRVSFCAVGRPTVRSFRRKQYGG
jgi:hypothetical protein